MLQKLKYLATIKDQQSLVSYFYCKEYKTFLPVNLKYDTKFPKSSDTIFRIINALKAKVVEIKIYREQEGFFYTYITLKLHGGLYDISSNFEDAFELSTVAKIPVYVEQTILQKNGIKVTKDMLEEILIN